ncbi:hypothetical protein SAMN05518683_102262 [Salibacterium halotolerans]|uniref:Uncharacterized protein n=1 Tax=Salibacterium halotolerans TaxID=1884432 RepID=A0A1I5MJT4_9BACI|nr:hypothetical protein SAMN05518683_102262 [Salibacterium halotolerans]
MGYFPNGTAGAAYFERYCSNCKNWTQREEDGCPIWGMHLADNYDLCNVEDNYLDKLIPRTEQGNKQCVMYLPEEG